MILAFYPADWSPVCGDQMALYNEVLPEFRKYGAEMLGISVDGAWCHAAFAKDRNLHFPLAADFEPKGAVARDYGAYRQEDGSASGRCSSSTKTGSSPGVTARPSRSIPAPTESSRHWKNWKIGSPTMTKLSVASESPKIIAREIRMRPAPWSNMGTTNVPHAGKPIPSSNVCRSIWASACRLSSAIFP